MVQIEEDVLIHGEIRARKIFSLWEVPKSPGEVPELFQVLKVSPTRGPL